MKKSTSRYLSLISALVVMVPIAAVAQEGNSSPWMQEVAKAAGEGRCEDAKVLALKNGSIEVAERALKLCAQPAAKPGQDRVPGDGLPNRAGTSILPGAPSGPLNGSTPTPDAPAVAPNGIASGAGAPGPAGGALVEPMASAPEAPAPESSVYKYPTITAPPPGKGQVIFYRSPSAFGALIYFKIKENEVPLGTLSYGKYFIHTAEPGMHTYIAQTESTESIYLNVKEGETYFVQGSISMGLLVGRPNIVPTDYSTFKMAVGKLKLAQ